MATELQTAMRMLAGNYPTVIQQINIHATFTRKREQNMTKHEALRQTAQENALLSLGFTRTEAQQLRRISMTLHRWHELECGTDSSCIVRGGLSADRLTFGYDDNGAPYLFHADVAGRGRYIRIPDRENGARKRMAAILAARMERAKGHNLGEYCGGCLYCAPVSTYIQTDPRGAALYIIRPGDVPSHGLVDAYYNRGICVY